MKTLDQYSQMPQISSAFQNWLSNITLVVITQKIVDGLVKETQTSVTFQGVIQPLTARQLMLKPEGERAWKWLQIHCPLGNLQLKPDDKIYYNNEWFKLMADNDYSLDNYNEYHVVKDYDKALCNEQPC